MSYYSRSIMSIVKIPMGSIWGNCCSYVLSSLSWPFLLPLDKDMRRRHGMACNPIVISKLSYFFSEEENNFEMLPAELSKPDLHCNMITSGS